MSDIAEQARTALARRHENPGPAYRDPVPTGVVELGDWASEHLLELLAEVERWQFECGRALLNLQLREDDVTRLRAEVERLRPRRIETVEELDALPDLSVVHPLNKTTTASIEKLHGVWWPPGSEGPVLQRLLPTCVPAVLLWEPEAQ